MIQFDNVSKVYTGGQKALINIDLTINRGQMMFLTGHSGAGKSTLLKLICGIERSTTGCVRVNGYDLSRIKPRQMPYFRRRIGMIFQDCALLDDQTVFDNVALPLIIEGYLPQDIKRRVAALDLVGLYGKEKYFPDMLSGGEQQRVGIARAVINKPALLLADEPTGNLDPALSESIMSLFQNFHDAGTTVLIATHDHALISRMRYPVFGLSQGCMLAPDAHNAQPTHKEEAFA